MFVCLAASSGEIKFIPVYKIHNTFLEKSARIRITHNSYHWCALEIIPPPQSDRIRSTGPCVRREPSGLLRQSLDWRSEEDDRQVATCPQLGSTNRLEHAQVRPGTHSFPAKSATMAGCCRPGSVQSLRPGVQMSAQDGS